MATGMISSCTVIVCILHVAECPTIQVYVFSLFFSLFFLIPCLADKCCLPYYGGCSYTRQCNSTENGTICGSCLFGYEEDPEDPSGDCIRKQILSNPCHNAVV